MELNFSNVRQHISNETNTKQSITHEIDIFEFWMCFKSYASLEGVSCKGTNEKLPYRVIWAIIGYFDHQIAIHAIKLAYGSFSFVSRIAV